MDDQTKSQQGDQQELVNQEVGYHIGPLLNPLQGAIPRRLLRDRAASCLF